MNMIKQTVDPTAHEGSMGTIDQIVIKRGESEEGDSAPAIAVDDLHKSFGTQKVLNGISLTVARGETLAVLGRSGTGKSVLLRLIIGLEKPDSGSVHIHDQDITGLNLDRLGEIRMKMGFLFQHAALYDSLTVEQNVAFPLQHHKKEMSKSEQTDRVKQLLAEVGMEGHLDKMPSDLSGGMQKRVGLARALALEPDILLLDEPTAGLDPISAGEIDDLVLKLQKEHHMASIVVTHDLHSAKTIADRLALLNEGNVVIEGSFEELQKSDIEFVREFLGHS
ncbi:MAG: ABC transporter ATP-binding protein [Terriglobales bacterium]|jgi:phospholipid/cholesterol/gamma-HCH transport system ATP-binding protein